MDVLSSAKSTILCGFPDFDTKFIYHHADNEPNDFQFFNQKRLFLEVNKKSGLELLRIKYSDSKDDGEISRIKKMKIDNLYCVACPKQEREDIALGLSTGQVKLLNYKTSEYTTKFPAETNRNSVIFLDFNASDEYLSSVYENGLINIYGLKTKTKLETINFDNNATLARFHPVKRFHLSIASYKGAIYVYDIQSKRKTYQSLDCHGAPCRDISMSPALPDAILSVGYDCIINIFDIRKKTQPVQIKIRHPLSTVAVSDCGNFFCVGNLKGELISYDLRNTKMILNSKKVHDTAVIRCAFVPQDNANVSYASVDGQQMLSEVNVKTTPNMEVANLKGNRDSFYDFLDFHSFKSRRYSTKRDSFDWDALDHRNVEVSKNMRRSSSARLSTENRLSLDSKKRIFIELDSTDSISKNFENSFNDDEQQLRRKSLSTNDLHCGTEKLKINTSSAISTRLKLKAEKSSLKHIEEESIISLVDSLNDNNANKENKGVSHYEDIDCFLKLPEGKNSTPNNYRKSNESIVTDQRIASNEIHEILSEFQNLRIEMNNKFNHLESEMKFNAEYNKWNIFTQNANLHAKQMKSNEQMSEALSYLLKSDDFVNNYLRLQKENAELKQTLIELKKNIPN